MRIELLERVRAELGRRTRYAPAAVSQYLAAAVADRVGTAAPAVVEAVRQTRGDHRAAALETLLRHAGTAARSELPGTLRNLQAAGCLPADRVSAGFAAPEYLERVVLLALERLLINAAAPPLLIAPPDQPQPLPAAASALWVAVCFDQPLAITHELYPLCTDAYVYGLEVRQQAAPELLGIHGSWLDGRGRILQAIHYDAGLDVFIEGTLPEPRRPQAALVIAHAPPDHAELGSRLDAAGIPYVNPARLSALADDKWTCWQRWRDQDVRTPVTELLPAATPAAAMETQSRLLLERTSPAPGGWFVQPRHGTEGRGVTWIAADEDCVPALLTAWRHLAESGDAILRPRVGLLGLAGDDGPLAWDLRINVCLDGQAHRATSACLLLAASRDNPVTSVEAGGQAAPTRWLQGRYLHDLLDPGAPPLPWSPAQLAQAARMAERAVSAIGPLTLAGVDLKFDQEGQGPCCSVLDVNPRPAGLLHANLLNEDTAGIGAPLWRTLSRLAGSVSAPGCP